MLVAAGAALIGAVVLVGQLPGFAPNVWTGFSMVAVVLVWLAVLLHWRRATSLYTITGERVYMAYGRIRFNLLQTTYDKVTDLHVHQSLFGRIWGFGTVRVQTAGTGLVLAGIVNPMQFKQELEQARSDFLHALVKNQKPTTKRPATTEASTRWTGQPAPASLLGGLLVAGVFAIAAMVLGVIGLVVAAEAGIGAAILFVSATAMAVGQWIGFRFTHYEVTTRGVVVTKGWLSRRRVEATFAKVTDVSVDQSILARLLGYGKITINTAGSNEAPVVFGGIADPDAVKAIIDEARGA